MGDVYIKTGKNCKYSSVQGQAEIRIVISNIRTAQLFLILSGVEFMLGNMMYQWSDAKCCENCIAVHISKHTFFIYHWSAGYNNLYPLWLLTTLYLETSIGSFGQVDNIYNLALPHQSFLKRNKVRIQGLGSISITWIGLYSTSDIHTKHERITSHHKTVCFFGTCSFQIPKGWLNIIYIIKNRNNTTYIYVFFPSLSHITF